MFKILVISILLAASFISSCMFKVPKHSDNAFENINDVSIRLVIRHAEDSLVRTEYEKRNNLPGNSCTKLETVNQWDPNQIQGVAIRIWTEIVMNEQGTFYGAYPKNGLLEKISQVNVLLASKNVEKDITKELFGDSTITSFVWEKHHYKKTPISSYMHKGGLKPAYFKNTEDWKTGLNNHADTLEWVSRYDYLFWFNRQTIRNLEFEPEWLKIRLRLTDSTFTKNRVLTDSIFLTKY
jgi:hypothetical protein